MFIWSATVIDDRAAHVLEVGDFTATILERVAAGLRHEWFVTGNVRGDDKVLAAGSARMVNGAKEQALRSLLAVFVNSLAVTES